MQFSGKITSSILGALARRTDSREWLFELTDIPLEFLRDPTSWLPAAQVESFVRAVDRQMRLKEPEFLVDVGMSAPELRCWGVLDSVLKMMSSPVDIFSQPQRFLSYFISPAPPIANVRKTADGVTFDLPITESEYPFTTAYLSSALAALPKYFGQEPAHVRWQGHSITILWSNEQASLLPEQERKRQPAPELLTTLLKDLEVTEARAEERELEVARLESEIHELRGQLQRVQAVAVTQPLAIGERQEIVADLQELRSLTARLSDYLIRTHQILGFAQAMLSGEVQFQSLLKRVDWEQIRTQYPWLQLQTAELFEQISARVQGGTRAPIRTAELASLREVLDGAVAKFSGEKPRGLKVETHWQCTEPVWIERDRLEVLLQQLLSSSAKKLAKGGELTISVHSAANKVALSLVEESRVQQDEPQVLPLLGAEGLSHDQAMDAARDVLSAWRGELIVRRPRAQVREVICEWPLGAV